MGVIINEFEMVVEPPAKIKEDSGEQAETQSEIRVKPMDIRNIICYQMERMKRLRAH